MVAYNFQRRFEPGIRAGLKRRTIRAPRAGRARHARPGDELQLFTGLRTRDCRLIGRATCTGVSTVLILPTSTGVLVYVDEQPTPDLEAFARADGFASATDFQVFWRETHGLCRDSRPFEGTIIMWGELL